MITTRSQTRKMNEQYYGEFDFDNASEEWNKNKKKIGNGCYVYVCGDIKSNGKKCVNKTCCGEKCRFHRKKN